MTETCNRCSFTGEPDVSITFFALPKGGLQVGDIGVKYSFHLKASCRACKRYMRFLPQEPELMSRITDFFKDKPLPLTVEPDPRGQGVILPPEINP